MTLNTIEREVEVECGEIGNYMALVRIEAHENDASFSHEFGIKKEKEIEIDDAELLEVTDDGGGDVTLLPQEEKDIILKAELQLIEDYRDGNL